MQCCKLKRRRYGREQVASISVLSIYTQTNIQHPRVKILAMRIRLLTFKLDR
uniref:Uncharacterized protein n=1 Tax=Anguilla anguilla TaxID=7936 RepID=A0A0E9TAU9_ANGAN